MNLYRIELRPSEITLLRRALAHSARFYQDLLPKSTPQWEKDDLRQKIKATEQLSNRLLQDVKPANTVSQAVLDRVMSELKDYKEAGTDTDWERAAEALIKSLIKDTTTNTEIT